MSLTVAVVRDPRYLEHNPGLLHPDRPERLMAVYRMIDQDFPQGLMCITPELATLDQLELVHSPAYVEKVLKTADQPFTHLAPDTPVSAKTYLSAFLAVGGCIRAAEALLKGQCHTCFALVRPPGHHAMQDHATGFSIFNNLGVTARYVMGQFGLSRILVVDWDIHHGQGIQSLFYPSNKVFYFSTHYPWLYPHTGDWTETGSGEGLGYTLNIPLPKGLGDQDMVWLYQQILTPVIHRLRPQMILVAAGFDGHVEDPMSPLQITERSFEWIVRCLIQLRSQGL